MGRGGLEEEEIALLAGVGQGGVCGDGGAFEKFQKVLFCCTTPDGLGYVTIDEKGLLGKTEDG